MDSELLFGWSATTWKVVVACIVFAVQPVLVCLILSAGRKSEAADGEDA
jgi:hypothetical protein